MNKEKLKAKIIKSENIAIMEYFNISTTIFDTQYENIDTPTIICYYLT